MPTAKPKGCRVLSYNLNLRKGTPFAEERIARFVERCDKEYDVLLLQEVQPASMAPSVAHRWLCLQRKLIDQLQRRGFAHFVKPKPSSWLSVLGVTRPRVVGLIVLSRFPIPNCGFFALTDSKVSDCVQGAVYAQILLTPETSVLMFDVHLPRQPTGEKKTNLHKPDHSRALCEFVLRVLNDFRGLPFVIAGDFNINSIASPSNNDSFSGLSSETADYSALVRTLQQLGTITEVVFDRLFYHPSTRPPILFYPSSVASIAAHRYPLRHDYFFFGSNSSSVVVDNSTTRIEKFMTPQSPFPYISDHFGISTTLFVKKSSNLVDLDPKCKLLEDVSKELRSKTRGPRRVTATEMEISHFAVWPWFFELSLLPLLFLLLTPWSIVGIVLIFTLFNIRRMFGNRSVGLMKELEFAKVTQEVKQGLVMAAIAQNVPGDTLWDLWLSAVDNNNWRPCLGMRRETDKSFASWMSFTDVHRQVVALGSGLKTFGLAQGATVGVLADSDHMCAILELACMAFGIVIVPLSGDARAIRHLLDSTNTVVAFSSNSQIFKLLNCRSRALTTVIQFQPVEYDENALAQNLGIRLTSTAFVIRQGENHPHTPIQPTANQCYTMTLFEESEPVRLQETTHKSAVRIIKAMQQASLFQLSNSRSRTAITFAPFSSSFDRLLVLAYLSSGIAVAFGDGGKFGEDLRLFRPQLMSVPPSAFFAMQRQFKETMKQWTSLRKRVMNNVYSFRSKLIRNDRDSATLRRLFFRSFERQFGGRLEKVILTSIGEVPFELSEFVKVCFTPKVRHVAYAPEFGLLSIDFRPPPGSFVRVVDEQECVVESGTLQLKHDGDQWQSTGVYAHWKEDMICPVSYKSDLLWVPTASEDAVVASTLERELKESPFVHNIFVTLDSHHTIVAVVVPNRESVAESAPAGTLDHTGADWASLAQIAGKLILDDFDRIVFERHIPSNHAVKAVHLHPYPFIEHNDFVTPNGLLRRARLRTYFEKTLQRLASNREKEEGPTTLQSPTMSPSGAGKRVPGFVAPISVDIGGTCTKLAFFAPPNAPRLPNYCSRETSFNLHSLTQSKGFFDRPDAFPTDVRQAAGMLQFLKMPTNMIPDFVDYVIKEGLKERFDPQMIRKVPATGGGAFKFSDLVFRKLEVTLDPQKEMDCIIKGLNFLISKSPGSIFTYDAAAEDGQNALRPHKLFESQAGKSSGFPYLLVNIGSGVSIVKCTSKEGTYVRVGGSAIGGGTFWGLVKTMTSIRSWEDLQEVTTRIDAPGDNANIDLLVGDIYGFSAKDLPQMLSVDTVASTFGKIGSARAEMLREPSRSPLETPLTKVPSSEDLGLAMTGERSEPAVLKDTDIVRSLLLMIANNVTQIAHLTCRAESVENVFFTGGFVRNNPVVWKQITLAMAYWSAGTVAPHFLQHDGYLGCLGSLLSADAL